MNDEIVSYGSPHGTFIGQVPWVATLAHSQSLRMAKNLGKQVVRLCDSTNLFFSLYSTFLAPNLTWQDLIRVFMVGTMEMKKPQLHGLSYAN